MNFLKRCALGRLGLQACERPRHRARLGMGFSESVKGLFEFVVASILST